MLSDCYKKDKDKEELKLKIHFENWDGNMYLTYVMLKRNQDLNFKRLDIVRKVCICASQRCLVEKADHFHR